MKFESYNIGYSLEQRTDKIIEACKAITDTTNPIEIYDKIAHMDFVGMHGQEHHILGGACILTAYYNAGGKLNLGEALSRMGIKGQQIPGAICGHWGMCGAAASIGAALSIIDGTGPVSRDKTWGEHMQCTATILADVAEYSGPRCCKRSGALSLLVAVEYINKHYDVKLETGEFKCDYSNLNSQCLKSRCPFFKGDNE